MEDMGGDGWSKRSAEMSEHLCRVSEVRAQLTSRSDKPFPRYPLVTSSR